MLRLEVITLYQLSMSEYPDLSYISFTVCGKNRLKPSLTTEMLQMINENQVAPAENRLCSSVLISDRFALTAAHCNMDTDRLISILRN